MMPIMMLVVVVAVGMTVRVADRHLALCPSGCDLRVEQPCADDRDETPAQCLQPAFGRSHGHAGRAQHQYENADDHERRQALERGGQK